MTVAVSVSVTVTVAVSMTVSMTVAMSVAVAVMTVAVSMTVMIIVIIIVIAVPTVVIVVVIIAVPTVTVVIVVVVIIMMTTAAVLAASERIEKQNFVGFLDRLDRLVIHLLSFAGRSVERGWFGAVVLFLVFGALGEFERFDIFLCPCITVTRMQEQTRAEENRELGFVEHALGLIPAFGSINTSLILARED